MKTTVFVIALIISAIRVNAAPINLIVNGDFSSGNVGFSTDYTYVAPVTGGVGPLGVMWPDGVYTVATSASGLHDLWVTGGDHTTGSGNFMLVNGTTAGPSSIWRETVSTQIGATYGLLFFAENMCCNGVGGVPNYIGPELEWRANGVLFGAGLTDGPGVWQPFGGTFTASSLLTTVDIRNTSAVYLGNDFGLDDIGVSLASTPEPTSLVLLGTGCVLLVRRMRNQNKGSD